MTITYLRFWKLLYLTFGVTLFAISNKRKIKIWPVTDAGPHTFTLSNSNWVTLPDLQQGQWRNRNILRLCALFNGPILFIFILLTTNDRL